MSDSANSKKMIGGYGSDDKVKMESGQEIVDTTNDPSGSAGSVVPDSNATDIDNLSDGATDYTSGGGTSGFGKEVDGVSADVP